ncbi:MAG: radical SAM protein [Patescibacteria group bacterium]|nr:radical SAM protein [Patescibacteria group bacterium]
MVKIINPLVVRIESTMLCNHDCPYCYNPLDAEELSIIEAKKRIRRLVGIINGWGTFDVTFTGGEPFLRKEVLYEGISAVKETEMDFGINTNATLITREDARRLKDLGVASVFASFPCIDKNIFEAMTRTEGSYERALVGFENLAREGIRTSANMVVVKNPVNNIDLVYDTAKMLVERFGILRFCAAPISPRYKEQEAHIVSISDIETIFEQMVKVHEEFGVDIRNSRPLPICFLEGMNEKFAKHDLFRGCTIGVVNGMTVDLNGNLKCCPVMSFPIANVFEDSLKTVMSKMAMYDGSDRESFLKVVPDDCLKCAILDVCKGGCKTEAMAMGKNIKMRSRYKKNVQKDYTLFMKVMTNANLLDGKIFAIRESIKWRKDSEDTFILRAEKFAILNFQEFEFFQHLYSMQSFNPGQIVKDYGLNSEKFNLFLNKLDKAKALVTIPT